VTGIRRTFVHEAVVELEADGDERGPGGAVTLVLCGAWEHPPPCPLAPHSTRTQRLGDRLELRVLFAALPDDEARVRALVDAALTAGECTGPDGVRTTWRVLRAAPSALRATEVEPAERLARD
jgi:hypothetical protein